MGYPPDARVVSGTDECYIRIFDLHLARFSRKIKATPIRLIPDGAPPCGNFLYVSFVSITSTRCIPVGFDHTFSMASKCDVEELVKGGVELEVAVCVHYACLGYRGYDNRVSPSSSTRS